MPGYLFEHPETGETKTVYLRVNEEKVYSEGGVNWNRVFTSPFAAVDTQINPFDSKEFARKTSGKRGTVGDLWDQSKEMSMKRERLAGQDSVKEQFKKDYSKKRRGTKPKGIGLD